MLSGCAEREGENNDFENETHQQADTFDMNDQVTETDQVWPDKIDGNYL